MASSSRQRITFQGAELNRLFEMVGELLEAVAVSDDWTTPVVLNDGDDEGHTPWRLSEGFLVRFIEFSQSVSAWVRFHGRQRQPVEWGWTLEQTEPLIRRLQKSAGLHQALADHDAMTKRTVFSAWTSPPDAEAICLNLIDAERAALLASFFERESGSSSANLRQQFFQYAETLLNATREAAHEENEHSFDAGLWHAQRRRINTLRLQCLTDLGIPEAFDFPDAFEKMKDFNAIRDALREMQVGINIDDSLYSPVNHVCNLIGSMGYDSFLSELRDGIDFGDPGEPGDGNTPSVHVIPGNGGNGPCARILMAFAKGSTGDLGLPKTMPKVNNYLIDCASPTGCTKAVVIFTNFWDASKFDKDHASTLTKWAGRGVGFLIIGIGYPDNRVTPLSVIH